MYPRASKIIAINSIAGLPANVKLHFYNCRLNIYSSDDNKDFICRLQVDGYESEDGGDELEFFDSTERIHDNSSTSDRYIENLYDPEEDAFVNVGEYEPEFELDESNFYIYSVPLEDMTFQTIAKNSNFKFELSSYQNKEILILRLNVKGTPYFGSRVVDECLYELF